MKKLIFFMSLMATSSGVFCSQSNTSGLVKLHRTDSPRFQLGMRDISESQMTLTQVYYSQEESDIHEEGCLTYSAEESEAPEESCLTHPMGESDLSRRLRKHKKITYIQSDSWPREKDNSQDLDYIPSQNVKRSFEDEESISSIDNIFEDVLASRETESYETTPSSPLFSSPNKRLRLSLDKNYYNNELNLIKNKNFLKKYKKFNEVKKLTLTVEDLQDASKFKFQQLKELNIDILIKAAKKSPKIASKKTEKLRQPILEEFLSKKNRRKLRNRRLKREIKKAAEKRLSKTSDKRLINQILSEKLPILLSENPSLERFSIQHINCEPLPSQIWNLKVKSLTLKMLGMTELSPEIRNLTNLEVLDLSNNKIKALPKEIGELKKLRELYLISNHLLEKFPNLIERLPNLEVLNIDAKQAALWEEDLQRLKEINQNLKIEIW